MSYSRTIAARVSQMRGLASVANRPSWPPMARSPSSQPPARTSPGLPRVPRFPTARCSCDLCACMIAGSSPGNRRFTSSQRAVLCISTPLRSLRINPASRSALKCCERVDLGTGFPPASTRAEHVCGQPALAILEKRSTRTGSERACRIPSTVMSSTDGCMRGFTATAPERLLTWLAFCHIVPKSHSSGNPNYRTPELDKQQIRTHDKGDANGQAATKGRDRHGRLEGHRRGHREGAGGGRRLGRRELFLRQGGRGARRRGDQRGGGQGARGAGGRLEVAGRGAPLRRSEKRLRQGRRAGEQPPPLPVRTAPRAP